VKPPIKQVLIEKMQKVWLIKWSPQRLI